MYSNSDMQFEEIHHSECDIEERNKPAFPLSDQGLRRNFCQVFLYFCLNNQKITRQLSRGNGAKFRRQEKKEPDVLWRDTCKDVPW